MKRCIILLLVFALLLLCGCRENTNSTQGVYTGHQTLTATEISLDSDTMFREDLKQAGLRDVFIRDIAPRVHLDSDTVGTVYLLADDRYGGGMSAADHYVAIVSQGVVNLHDLSLGNTALMNGELTAADFDGDGDDELLLWETVAGATGGFGQYVTRVLDIREKSLVPLFSSHDEQKVIDTGFSAEVLPNNRLVIRNRFTDYADTFEYDEHPFWYDEKGNPKEIALLLDSFYRCEAVDVDRDGVYELFCDQYTSLYDHSDYVGTVSTVFRYNTATSAFEVVDANFTP